MKSLLITSIIFISIHVHSQSPNFDFGYEFFIDKVLSVHDNPIIMDRNASGSVYELFINQSEKFDFNGCLFIDNKYYSEKFWDSLVNQDIDYLYEQINRLNRFRWEKDKLPPSISLWSKMKVKGYSREVNRWMRRYEKTKKDFKLVTIHSYCLPLFNKAGNFAIIYHGTYTCPEGASTAAKLYLKVDGKWKNIGELLHSMS